MQDYIPIFMLQNPQELRLFLMLAIIVGSPSQQLSPDRKELSSYTQLILVSIYSEIILAMKYLISPEGIAHFLNDRFVSRCVD